MSDSFRKHFGFDDEGDGTYHAWRTCQQGATMNLKLVPASSSDQPTWQIPYLQPISIRLDPDKAQLCLICHSTDMTVFLEGRGLEDLADLISEKRVRSIHEFDAAAHHPIGNNTPIITKINVEKS